MIRGIEQHDAPALAALFEAMRNDPACENFRPHPFTGEHAETIARRTGRDVYLGAWSDDALTGYGMLRGFDAGYEIPSLGIYIAPSSRGTGLSRGLMDALHQAAGAVGASKVRLRVRPDNERARRLYERCAYVFDGSIERGEFVGLKQL